MTRESENNCRSGLPTETSEEPFFSQDKNTTRLATITRPAAAHAAAGERANFSRVPGPVRCGATVPAGRSFNDS